LLCISQSEIKLKAYCDQLLPKGWKGWVPATDEEVEAWWRNEMGERPKNIMAAMGISRGVLKRMLRNVSRTITDFERWDYELSTGVRNSLRVWVRDVDSKLKLQAAIENKELPLSGKDVTYRGKKLTGFGSHAFEELQSFCR
tara:strand:+ start:7727 stop:8152 length:426 start_codon:yes stop_codon:yes gene_type:complete